MFIHVMVQSVIHTCFCFGSRCGAEGVKVECKGNNNTICNEIIEGKGYLSVTTFNSACWLHQYYTQLKI